MVEFGIAILLFLVTFIIRILPIINIPHRGCDAYYFLLCAEQLKKDKKIPIVLPRYYLLEYQEQWYPPGFTVFLALIPKKILDKYYWMISPFVDSLIGSFCFIYVYVHSGSLLAACVANILYAVSTSVISECTSLTSRQLGSLLLTATMVLAFSFINSGNYVLLPFFILVGFLLLMTHKMSSQDLYFVLPVLSLVFLDFWYAVLLVALMVATWILSGGFFWKVLKAHYDILSFWNRHWHNLGAHPIYDSPTYSDGKNNYGNKYHQDNIRSYFMHVRTIIGENLPFLLVVIPTLYYKQLNILEQQLFWWVVSTYVLAAATIFVPQLRFLGEGHKYLKMIAFPIAYLAILPLWHGWAKNVMFYYYFLLLVVLALSMVKLIRFYKSNRSVRTGQTGYTDGALEQVFEFLKSNLVTGVVCIPYHLYDIVVYHCGLPVLWGTHGYPFAWAEPFMPVLRKPIESFAREYSLSHLLIDTNYVEPAVLKLESDNLVFSKEHYQLYSLKD